MNRGMIIEKKRGRTLLRPQWEQAL